MIWLLSQLDQQALRAAIEEAGTGSDEPGPATVLLELHARRVRLFEESLTDRQARLLSGIEEIQSVMDGCMRDTLFLQGLVLGSLIEAGLAVDYRAVVQEASPGLIAAEDELPAVTLPERLALAGIEIGADELDEAAPEAAIQRFREFIEHLSPEDFGGEPT